MRSEAGPTAGGLAIAAVMLVALAGSVGAQDDEAPPPPEVPEHCNQAIPPVVHARSAALDAPPPPPPETRPEPPEFLPARGRDCHRYRGQRVCEGPRRVPRPHGQAAARAERLGLGTRTVGSRLLTGPPDPAWTAAAPADRRFGFDWPVHPRHGRIWRGFRGGRRGHAGIDIGADAGTLVRVPRAGIVAYADNGIRGYGNLVILVHADGTTTWYGHLRASWLFAGEQVERGRVLGEVGATGLARGAHLHFEWRVEGVPTDPRTRLPALPDGADPP